MSGEKDSGWHHNHYVPEWYQKRFLNHKSESYWYLDMNPERVTRNGHTWTRRALLNWGPPSCFAEDDLYTVRFGDIDSTRLEREFFGPIDTNGRHAVEYFDSFSHPSADHKALLFLLKYITVQRLRTPKGLDALKGISGAQTSNQVLALIPRFQNLFGAVWSECVWQIADATQSATKFIVSDHPVTVYNRECPTGSIYCRYPGDPDIRLLASHTLFPLSRDRILIMTNLGWVRDPYQSGLKVRENPNYFRSAVFNYTHIQTSRNLAEEDVIEINYIMKKRAKRYIAAGEKDWLYPERYIRDDNWRRLGDGYLLMPDPRHIHMGGEIVMGYDDGRAESWNEYGQRPWEKGFQSKTRFSRESEALERFKSEWSTMFGPVLRGRVFDFGRTTDKISEQLHKMYLEADARYSATPGERARRRQLRRASRK